MRATPIAAGLLFVSLALLVPSAAEARSVACTDLRDTTNSCPGFVCVDEDLDGRLQSDECVIIYCLHGCCGAPCPPPEWD